MDRQRVAIVTGGSRGIGRATAVAFAKSGFSIVTCGRDERALAITSNEIERVGAPFSTVIADIGRRSEVERLVQFAIDRFGRVDVLVNNAGVAPKAPIDELAHADFESAMSVNIGAVFHATRAVWPTMKIQGGGTIVNISSLASVDPFPGFQVYGATKAWVNVFTKAVADEGRAIGVRAFSLALGTVETDMLRGLFPDYPSDQTLAPSEVAAVIVDLASPTFRHASGSTIIVRK